MALDVLERFLEELAEITQIAGGLKPDENHTCFIQTGNGVGIQIELDREQQNFILYSELGEVPPGKYREELFRVILITNGLPPPRDGVLAFSGDGKTLILFDMLPVERTNAKRVSQYLPRFLAKGQVWKESLESSSVPQVIGEGPAAGPAGGGIPFGLKP